MRNLLLIALIILFLTSACSNKQPEVVIETKRGKIYDVLRLKEVQDFLYDIRMN